MHSRVVDEDVDRADRLLAAIEDRRDRIELGEVCGHHGDGRAVARETAADFFEPLGSARDEHQIGAGDSERLGEFDAETARGAGDDGVMTAKSEDVLQRRHERIWYQPAAGISTGEARPGRARRRRAIATPVGRS